MCSAIVILLFIGCAPRLEEPSPECRRALAGAYAAENTFYLQPDDSVRQADFFAVLDTLVVPVSCSLEYTSYLGMVRSNSHVAIQSYTFVLSRIDSLIGAVPPGRRRANDFGPAYNPGSFRARLLRHKARALFQRGDFAGADAVYATIEIDALPDIEQIHLAIYSGEAKLAIGGERALVEQQWEQALERLGTFQPVNQVQNAYRNMLRGAVHKMLSRLYEMSSGHAFPVVEHTESAGASLIRFPQSINLGNWTIGAVGLLSGFALALVVIVTPQYYLWWKKRPWTKH